MEYSEQKHLQLWTKLERVEKAEVWSAAVAVFVFLAAAVCLAVAEGWATVSLTVAIFSAVVALVFNIWSQMLYREHKRMERMWGWEARG